MVDELRGISPRLARRIARHRPEIERILRGKSEPTERKTTKKERIMKIFRVFKEFIRIFKGTILIIAVAFNAAIILTAWTGAFDVYYENVLISREELVIYLLIASAGAWVTAGSICLVGKYIGNKKKTKPLSIEELTEKICNDVEKISPETARRFAKHIPEIERILDGQNPHSES